MFDANPKTQNKIDVLSEALTALSPGETVSYAILSKLSGERVTSQSYILQRALKRAEEVTGALFENVVGEGYQRLPTHEIPGVGKKANSRIRKTARRARKRLETIRANDMTTKEVGVIAAYRSHFGMIEGIAREQSIAALEKTIDTTSYVAPKQAAARMQALMTKGAK